MVPRQEVIGWPNPRHKIRFRCVPRSPLLKIGELNLWLRYVDQISCRNSANLLGDPVKIDDYVVFNANIIWTPSKNIGIHAGRPESHRQRAVTLFVGISDSGHGSRTHGLWQVYLAVLTLYYGNFSAETNSNLYHTPCGWVDLLLECANLQGEQADVEYKVKAAFLLNFARLLPGPRLRNAQDRFPCALSVVIPSAMR